MRVSLCGDRAVCIGPRERAPVIDWVGHAQTGAVLDLEGGWWINPQWTLALLAGGLLWGKGVPSTYEGRVEIKLIRRC